MRRSAPGRAEVGIDSFDKGLVTLYPSEQAGNATRQDPGPAPNPQSATIQYGPNLRNAVVRASNVRFENGAASSAPGNQLITGGTLDSEPILIYESQQIGSNIPGDGKFLFVCTEGSIYLVGVSS